MYCKTIKDTFKSKKDLCLLGGVLNGRNNQKPRKRGGLIPSGEMIFPPKCLHIEGILFPAQIRHTAELVTNV